MMEILVIIVRIILARIFVNLYSCAGDAVL